MVNQLLKDLYVYLQAKQNRTAQEDILMQRLFGELQYYIISRVHRSDLQSKGFDVSQVTDAQMARLASKLGDDYCTQLFWDSMDIIAADSINIPKETCPVCNTEMKNYECDHFECEKCGITWQAERFVLITSDVVNIVREKGIGYVCIDHSCPHAQYIPLHLHGDYFTEDYTTDMVYRIVTIEDTNIVDNLIETGYRVDRTSLSAANNYGKNSFWVSVNAINDKEIND